jgi:predicted CoA-binding protein
MSAGEEAVIQKTIQNILETTKVIAVVGLSRHAWRPSNRVSGYMQAAGYRIIPVNPNEREVLGEKAYATLDEVPEKIDLVNVFRRSEFVPPVVEAAIRVEAKAVWMQEEVVHEEAARQARAAGLPVVMDRCIMQEHMRWKQERVSGE